MALVVEGNGKLQTNADVIRSLHSAFARGDVGGPAAAPHVHLLSAVAHPVFDRYATNARKTAGWGYHELAASHEPFVTHSRELADLLLKAAA